MNETVRQLMSEATRLTRAGDLRAATAAIQSALARSAQPAPQQRPRDDEVIDVEAREVPDTAPTDDVAVERPTPEPPHDDAGRFIAGHHADAGLQRDYKLYIPPGAGDRPLPLVVMLHGCTQDPDDFAAGTAMNELARAHGAYVLYPAQSQRANPQRCWNWFKHNHQRRGRGEPALLAGMTRAVMAAHAIDPERVYVAGLSAGGAMAAVLGNAYPELYAAVGVHSGLAAGAASDLASALAAMKDGGANAAGGAASGTEMPTIVFHGDADQLVHPGNADRVIAASAGTAAAVEVEQLRSAGGRSFTRSVHRAADGRLVAEHWLVHGAPHAWSGGRSQGSYTDGRGPDASAEMLRFFLQQRRRAA